MDLVTLALAKKFVSSGAGSGTSAPGQDGKSAYEIAVENGFEGTEKEWLSSLQGEDGYSPTIIENADNDDTTYKLDIVTKTGSVTTPNLMGKDGDRGEKGETGATPNLQIGEVITLNPGEAATATITGTPENPQINLGIPKGESSEGDSYTLPIMTSAQLGGGKAVEKTTESVPVAVDENGQLWVPQQTGGSGGTSNYNDLSNKPQLNGVTLEGNNTLDQVGVLARNQGASNSGKYLSVGSDGNVVPADAPSGGTVDPEQIKQAVNGYLEENPVQSTPIDKTLTKENEAADAFVTGSRLVGIEKQFKNILTAPRKINRALIASDKKIYYKDQTEESYDKYNLFIFDVSDTNIVENIELRSNQNIIRVKISEQSINELEKTILELNRGTGVFIGTDIYFGTEAEYKIENLDVSQAKTILVYTGIDVDELDYTAIYGLTGKMVSPENTTFISSKSGTEFENYEYTENNQNDILGYYNVKEKLYAYKNTSANPTFAISFLVDTEHAYKITASGITRCRIGLFDTYNLTYGSTIENSTNAYATIAHDDTKTDIDIEFIPEINGLVVAYLSNTSSDVDVTVQSSGIDLYALDSKVKVGNENIPDNTIKKEKLAFDISAGSSATNGKIPLLSDILTSNTEDIDTIFEFESAPNTWVTDSTGKVLDVSTDNFYELFYNTWLGNHPDGFTVTRTQLGVDQSGNYPIYEYDFCPQNYTYTVLLSSGMHTYELSAHFGLAWFMKTYMRQVDGESLSDGFEYLRKHVRIKVVPISNPWGWNQSPKKYGNCNGVNINRNFDYETDDGGSSWEQFPVQTDEWNQKGSAPFSEAETRILRDWALENSGAYFWIDCHTGLGLGPWDNFIYYSSDDKYVDKIAQGLSTLEERIKTKYSKQNPTKEVRIDHSGSIRLKWGERVAGIPGMTIEQTPGNTLWGTALNNESGDITEFAVTVYCYLFSVLPYNIDAETWISSLLSR